MNPLTAEWIEKASADLATAGREMRARKDPNYDAVCFHAQQCVEKLLQAALKETGRDFPEHMISITFWISSFPRNHSGKLSDPASKNLWPMRSSIGTRVKVLPRKWPRQP